MNNNLIVSSILANMDMIKYLLNQPLILNREVEKTLYGEETYNTINHDNVELRLRIKLLRKELKKLEKEIMEVKHED